MPMKIRPSTRAERDWPDAVDHNYWECTCLACGEKFCGYKRRVQCRHCATWLNKPKRASLAIRAKRPIRMVNR